MEWRQPSVTEMRRPPSDLLIARRILSATRSAVDVIGKTLVVAPQIPRHGGAGTAGRAGHASAVVGSIATGGALGGIVADVVAAIVRTAEHRWPRSGLAATGLFTRR